MKIKVLERTSNELKIEVEGIDHTLCSMLQKILSEDAKVDLAGYDIPHPLSSNPILHVRTRGTMKPEDAVLHAIEKVRHTNRELSAQLEKELKKT